MEVGWGSVPDKIYTKRKVSLTHIVHVDLSLILGPRHLAVVGKKGHVATFDWQAGTLHTELQLQETCRDIT